ncbi:MAG: restriction endonuclease subunit S [Candidatus Marinimicrobia bacterium]|nr:restriction endonuclease subunit S [Candidatus Neomarinimicrobiota bacterium]
MNQSVIALEVDKKQLDSKFLFYNLRNRYNELRAISDSNSSRGSITTKILGNLKIKFPPLPTQRRIAAILSSLDDKIENNRRICNTLEADCQAVFKRWFVDYEFPDEQRRPYRSSGGRMIESELGMISGEVGGTTDKTVD